MKGISLLGDLRALDFAYVLLTSSFPNVKEYDQSHFSLAGLDFIESFCHFSNQLSQRRQRSIVSFTHTFAERNSI